MFYLRSRHGDTGNNVVFHRKNGRGYTTNLDALHVFTKEEAQQHLDWDARSLPLLKSAVDDLSIRSVDCQTLNHFYDKNKKSKYVIQIPKIWNGNDIYFKSGDGNTYNYTYNYDKATKYDYEEASRYCMTHEYAVAWSTDYLDTRAKRTFQNYNINTRKMITGPGIKYKKPRKQRPVTGKTRLNCGTCGKIVWDYNPHETVYCNSICELFIK